MKHQHTNPITNVCRRANIYFDITLPTPGTFIITLHYKPPLGCEKAMLEMDLKIDDLLEKVCRLMPYDDGPCDVS